MILSHSCCNYSSSRSPRELIFFCIFSITICPPHTPSPNTVVHAPMSLSPFFLPPPNCQLLYFLYPQFQFLFSLRHDARELNNVYIQLHNLLSSLIQRAQLLVQISDIFQLCHAMDKLFCVKTVLLKLIEVGMADVCIMHVQIIHP